ncbi:hypothetical protein M427DRAFT_62358 [Gonapodya prolifera JEL478]|uniref:Beta-adaptin appendage C-terminal subdomain domain-containing protein n=1 Tax=Gonapodya prolifera (strain JEL478) TaxID=1344416 RepID=A0A139A0S8_GONPJ|nr:hypothetical protein M427DRAFT_62358 [Gonapodya prolifera JEL478]|eukprot:KXS10387.1 hypothetical protein M427DRAFT_62358 [Gonapodya prolifera JEL478]
MYGNQQQYREQQYNQWAQQPQQQQQQPMFNPQVNQASWNPQSTDQLYMQANPAQLQPVAMYLQQQQPQYYQQQPQYTQQQQQFSQFQQPQQQQLQQSFQQMPQQQQLQQQQPSPAFAVNASAWTTTGQDQYAAQPQQSAGSPAMGRMVGSAPQTQKETSTGIGRPAYRWALSGNQQMQPWVPPAQVWYQQNGVTIGGTFARREGRMLLELQIQNGTNQPMRDLAVSFGRNKFTLGPAIPRLSPSTVPPGGTVEASVQLRVDADTGSPSNPPNLIPITLSHSLSSHPFTALLPIHVLFTEQGLVDQSKWLKMWTEAGASEWACPLQGMRFSGVDELRGRLGVNNVFVVAQRIVNGVHFFYASMALPDHPTTVFVAEISLDERLSDGKLSVKIPGKSTDEAGEIVGAVFESVGRMMVGQ